MRREDILRDMGFSKNETRVYLTLLRIGPSTAGALAASANIHRTNAYDALERLIEKGVVTYIFKGNKKYFEAVDPNRLLELLKDHAAQFENNILPSLLLDYKLSRERNQAHIYDGITGVKAITDDILKDGQPVYTFGVPHDVAEKMKNFVSIYHKRRVEKKMWQYHIYDANARERISYLNTVPYTKARYIPREQDSPATTTIYGDKVAFLIYCGKSQKNSIDESE